MNQLAHIFINYTILSFIIPQTQKYLIPIAIFSIILDIDHVPSYIKMIFISKKEKAKMKLEHYVDWFRTAIQEPIGIITIELILFIFYLYGVRNIILLIAIICIFLHWLVDFLTVHTRPLDPLNKKKIVSLFFHTTKQRIWSEIIITVVFLVVFLILYL